MSFIKFIKIVIYDFGNDNRILKNIFMTKNYDFCYCVAFLTKYLESIDLATFLYAVVGIYINTMKTAFLFKFLFLQALSSYKLTCKQIEAVNWQLIFVPVLMCMTLYV